ncbi:hypothetical protein H6B28_06645 [Bacteroides mediterraneensis]|nr:hypothetical protein [Bacteroides mediterraneensis]
MAAVLEGAIPFVFDGHPYLRSTCNDSLPVTVVYDTGADYLYLDADYLTLPHQFKIKILIKIINDIENFRNFILDNRYYWPCNLLFVRLKNAK